MPFVFLHGLGQGPDSWAQTTALLNGRREYLCPDLYGSLRGAQACTYPELYHAIRKNLERTGGPLSLCGLSLGGILALQYGAEHPDQVRSLVLIGTQYKMPKMLLQLQEAIFRVMPERFFGQSGLSKAETLQLTGSMRDLDFSVQLPKITCPVLILCGEKDKPNLKAADALKNQLPQGQLQIIKGAGHEVNKENPERLAEILNEFYSQEERV